MKSLFSFFNSRKVAPYLFLLPFLTIFVVFKVWPIYTATRMSFQDVASLEKMTFVGTENYTDLADNIRFHTAVENTARYTVGILLVLVPIPLLLAVFLNSKRLAGKTFFRTMLFLPALTSLVVVGTIFRLLLNANGVVNSAVGTAGIEPQRWLEVPRYVIPAMIVMAFWRWTGINIIYFNSGLVNIPGELYEAAAIDGANRVQSFWHITLPLLRPTTIFVSTLTIIGGFQLFVEPFILFPGGRTPGDSGLSIAYLIYRTAFNSFQLGPAAAMGVVLGLIILTFSLLQFRFFRVLKED